MELEYRFPNLPELKKLRILMNNDSGKIKASVRGTYSLKTWFLIKTRYAGAVFTEQQESIKW